MGSKPIHLSGHFVLATWIPHQPGVSGSIGDGQGVALECFGSHLILFRLWCLSLTRDNGRSLEYVVQMTTLGPHWKPGQPIACSVIEPHDSHIWGASAGGYSYQCSGVTQSPGARGVDGGRPIYDEWEQQ